MVQNCSHVAHITQCYKFWTLQKLCCDSNQLIIESNKQILKSVKSTVVCWDGSHHQHMAWLLAFYTEKFLRRQLSKCFFFHFVIWSSFDSLSCHQVKSSMKIRHPRNNPVGKAEEQQKEDKKLCVLTLCFYRCCWNAIAKYLGSL